VVKGGAGGTGGRDELGRGVRGDRLCLHPPFRLNEPQVLAARDPDALHQARVALRRLRSAFSIFRPLVAGEQGDAIRAELGWISRVLGEARDLDVFIQKRLGNADPMLADKVHAARGTAYDAALAALDSERFRGAMLNLVAWIATGDWRREHAEAAAQPVTAFAASALDRFWRKVKKGGRGLGTIGDEARHDVRIAGKKLRYAAEFFAALQKGKKQGRSARRSWSRWRRYREISATSTTWSRRWTCRRG
jgi:CHAD domain-containing protein